MQRSTLAGQTNGPVWARDVICRRMWSGGCCRLLCSRGRRLTACQWARKKSEENRPRLPGYWERGVICLHRKQGSVYLSLLFQRTVYSLPKEEMFFFLMNGWFPLDVSYGFLRLFWLWFRLQCGHESGWTDSDMAHHSRRAGIAEKDHFGPRRFFADIVKRWCGFMQTTGATASRLYRESKDIISAQPAALAQLILCLCMCVFIIQPLSVSAALCLYILPLPVHWLMK